MSKSDYAPYHGTRAAAVVAFFQACPDEELTRSDMAAKFDVQASSVDTMLSRCVATGLLRTDSTENGKVWQAGPNIGRLKASPAPVLPAGVPVGKRADATTPPLRNKPPRRLPPLDVNALEVRDDLPMPHPQGPEPTYPRLLAKLTAVGQCVTGIPRAYYGALGKAASAYGRKQTPPRRYSVQNIDDASCGVWRIA